MRIHTRTTNALALGLLLIASAVSAQSTTPGEIAGNGPLPADPTQYASEFECVQSLAQPQYYASMNGAEVSDSTRSALYPCWTFGGDFDSQDNFVYAWQSEDSYPGVVYLNTREPSELYLTGGGNPPATGPVPAGPFVAKVDPSSGKELWRTYFDNANVSQNWVGATNLNILPDGNIVHAWHNSIAILDGDTGNILRTGTLPTGDTDPKDVNYKHITIAPDGTIIAKNQTRPIGSNLQGTIAIIVGVAEGLPHTPSYLAAVDPDTLEVIDGFQLPEPATTPHVITEHDGKIAIYVSMDTIANRYFWEPRRGKLVLDESWSNVAVTQPGQSTADAASLIGDWVVFQTNGIGSTTVNSSLVAVNAYDATNIVTYFPFGALQEGQVSGAPPKAAADPDNNMLVSADVGLGKMAGIHIDPDTGAMETMWTVDQASSAFMPLLGPADQRILAAPSDQHDADGNVIGDTIVFRNLMTGELIAESDVFPPFTSGEMVTAGFGGRMYLPTNEGFIITQVGPPPPAPATSTAQSDD